MKPVHIVGMGVLGCLLAWHLEDADIEFTWEDTHDPHSAWQASAGLIYPSGDAHDSANYDLWDSWARGHAPWGDLFRSAPLVERSGFWFSTKAPPNGGTYRIVARVGPLNLGELPALTFNTALFVRASRIIFAARERVGSDAPAGRVVVAHGSACAAHYAWGWTVGARLAVHSSLAAATQELSRTARRPSFFLRVGRFRFGYANVLPGIDDMWIGGSSHVPQDVPHALAMRNKVEKWQEHLETVSGGLLRVMSHDEPIVGWRPMPPTTLAHAASEAGLEQVIRGTDGSIYVPAMGGSGVRHAPLVIRQVLNHLQA